MKKNKGLIPVSIVIAVVILVFGWIQIEKIKTDRIDTKFLRDSEIEFTRKTNLEDCVAGVELQYSNNWDSQCKMLKKDADCSLPGYLSDTVDKVRNDGKDLCIDMYR